MMAAPTPGKWEAQEVVDGTHEVFAWKDFSGFFICKLSDESVGRKGESEHNAHLIAAAPDLLEAASYLLAHGDHDPDNGHSAETYNEAWEMLEKAVDKAEVAND